MEEVGAQVASPIFFHQALPGRFCEAPPMAKKRDLAWQNANFQQQQQQRLNPAFQNPKANWKPQVWDWDSTRFVAKPSEAEVLRLGTAPVVESVKEKKGEETLTPMLLKKNAVDEEGESLTLKLGGSSYSVDETAARPNKRVRSGSPGGGNYPMCQVDDCKGDLSNAKDYHRRHKVCEFHSKTTKALVGKQMQRFCQQCSRFHPLPEFDEGKRSCRRRLAGHNRRRRKTQPEDVSSRLLLPDNCENTGSENLNVVNLLSIISRLQGNNANKGANCSPLPDKDQLIQILNKINSLPLHANSTSRLPAPGSFDLNISQQASLDHLNKTYGSTSAQSTMDLLAVLSAALAAASPDALAMLSHRSSNSSDDDKTKSNCLDQAAGCTAQKKSTSGFPSVVGERSSSNFQSPAEILDCQIQDSRPSLPFQLFSSSPEGNSPPKLGSSRKYFSSESSNPMEERSPSSSPVVQKLFPLQSATEIIKHERMSISGEDNATVAASTTHGWIPSLELFNVPNGRVEHGSAQNLPYQAGYSSSGSDHSPSSSNSDAQDRTGRIIFKLFDKDPSDLPGTLRTQILNWLSNSPSEMESYIRPGCVVLSVYVSMPSTAWEQLQDGLLRHVNSLIKDSDSGFWQNGRFLVHTGRQLVLHKDGKVRLCKSWRTWSAPELISVSPLAVVGGQETSLVLRGRNLTVPGTKIHCTYMGGYMSKETSGSAYQGTAHDEISLESFKFPGGAPGVLGRCFVEVENGFKGNSFPVIIADATICHELKHLESEFEEDAKMSYVVSEDHLQDSGQPRSREDVLHFLNELGWLFQKNNTPSRPEGINFSHSRFKFLFTFSVERDWCALVKTLLDILVERNLGKDGLWKESLETLSEIQLLNRAVKRKCWNMVDLLIHYSLTSSGNATKKYLFPPNIAGPGGVTPLHLAACMQDSEDMVDVLTNDPQEIGLGCWNSLLDANGQSPFAYASMRNNHSYNSLVARKIADRKHGQVSIAVGDEISLDRSWILAEQADKPDAQSMQRQQSCARCAVVATRNFKRMPGAQGLLYRPYVHSMLAIAAVCVCVCLFLRGSPDIGSVAPFKWETLGYGWS